MDKWKFLLCTLVGCLPWNITLVYLGWLLGSSWEAIVATFTYINIVVFGAIILLAAWFVWRASHKKRVS